jgi:hypothetical protein
MQPEIKNPNCKEHPTSSSSDLLDDDRKAESIDALLGRAAVALDNAAHTLKTIRTHDKKKIAKFRSRVTKLKSAVISIGVGFENFINAESSNY